MVRRVHYSLRPTPAGPAADCEQHPVAKPYSTGDIAIPEHHLDSYPDAFLTMVRRMLAFDPSARPSVAIVLRLLWNAE